MNRLFIVIVTLITLVTAHAQPHVEWLTTVHDFAAFNEDCGKQTVVFQGVSTGDEPLVVVDARANCGCTTPRYNADEILPGDTLSVTVSYDPQGRPGRFTKYVYIYTNAPEDEAKSRLTIKGVVIGSAQTVALRFPVTMGVMGFDRNSSLLGSIKKGCLKMFTHKGYNMSADSIRPAVKNTPKWLEVSVAPPVTGPGEIVTFNFYVTADKSPLYGIVTDTITIIPDASRPDEGYLLPVIANFEEDFSQLSDKEYAKAPIVRLSDERVNLGIVNAGEALEATYRVENAGKSPLLIRRFYTTDPGVSTEVSTRTVKSGKTATLKVYVAPEVVVADRPVNIQLQLITNDPTEPVLNLRLTAEPR